MNKRAKPRVPAAQKLRRQPREVRKEIGQRSQGLVAKDILAQSILDQATEAIVVCDPDGRITMANRAAHRLCGTDPIGQPFREVLALRLGRGERPSHLQERRQQPRLGPEFSLEATCAELPVRGLEVNLPRQNGSKFHLLLSAGLLLGAQGENVGCIVTLTDVTELRLAEAALQEGEARFGRLAQSSVFGILLADEERFFEANDALLDMLGLSRQDLTAGRLRWRELTLPEYREAVERAMEALSATGYVPPLEVEYLRSDGQRVPLLLHAVLLQAAPLRWMGVVANLTERQAAEHALRLSRERFSKAFEASPDGLVISRMADGKIIEVNESYQKLMGYRRDEMIGQSSLALNLFQNPADRQRAVEQLQAQGRLHGYGMTLRRKSGELRQVSLSVEKLSVDGQDHLLTIVHDVTELVQTQSELQHARGELELRVQERTAELAQTNQALQSEIAERKRAEEALRQSRMLFESLLESAPDAILSVDANGKIVLVNSQVEKVFGYRREELLGQSVEALLPDRFRTGHVEHRQRYGQAPTTRPMGIGLDLQGRRKDGSEFPVEISLSPVNTREGTLVVSIIRDVSERVRAEQALKNQAARLQEQANLIDLAHDAIIIRDMNNRILSWNHGAQETYGWSKEEALGRVMHQFVETQFPTWFEDVRAQLLREGRWEGELTHTTRDGHLISVACRMVLQRDERGQPRAILVINRDVTARLRAEEEIRKLNAELEQRVRELDTLNKELESFSYSVSHDLRAPLRAIDGFSQALVEDYGDSLDAQGQDYVRRVHAATQRLTQLIDDLLALSRVTRSEMHREDIVDLSGMAQGIVAQLRAAQPERHVESAIEPGLATRGDSHLLRIALENLIGNAWKFTSKAPSARIEFGAVGPEDGRTVYFVRDNGAGFDMTYADKLFGPFQRLHSTADFPGTGIGLATVQRIVHRHGGRVWAESTQGRGATFYFTL